MLLASATRAPATSPATPPSAAVNVDRGSNKTRTTAAPTAAATDVAAAPAAPIDAPRSASAPRWITSAPPVRGRAAANGVVFELAADEDVKVWRNRVRPVLTVRCVAKTTEVFVMTRSAASIEGNTSLHTVQVGFDGGDAAAQMWEHSVDHDALFAPDGRALVHQIAGARSMSFTFTPFNASPAAASFSVAGFDAQLKSAAKKCS